MKKNSVFVVLIILLISCNSSDKTKTIGDYSRKDPSLNLSSELKSSIERGSKIYAGFCVTCHLPDGKGVKGSFPPLANSDYLKNKRVESIKAIKYGLSGEIKVNGETYNTAMLSLGLSDDEVADVMNYITNSWGNQNSEIITPKEVSEIEQ